MLLEIGFVVAQWDEADILTVWLVRVGECCIVGHAADFAF